MAAFKTAVRARNVRRPYIVSGFAWAVIVLAVGIRLFVGLHLPLHFLYLADYDDALFVRLAIELASGHWLGSFDQMTLAKGPGYPLFLALSSLSGLPVSLTHSLFHLMATAVAAWTVFRLSASRWLGILAFLLLSLHPVAFQPELLRVFRDQIYWGQSLLVFSLFSLVLFAPPRARSAQWLLCGLSGLALAWTWLTREEGIWLLPGLGVIAGGSLLIHRYNRHQLLQSMQRMAAAAATFGAAYSAFTIGNRIAYGSFVAVDFNERNFGAVIRALQSVDVGPIQPFVPVPLAARQEVGKHSPTFRPLADALAPGGSLVSWEETSCSTYPSTCGDIAGGLFVWALRDAAADQGFYRSPAMAARQFGRVAQEITDACSEGRLRCRIAWFDFLPPMSDQQWRSLPYRFLSVGLKVAFLDPADFDARLDPSPELLPDRFERYWAFLNYPLIVEDPRIQTEVTVVGWYYDPNWVEWPDFRAHSSLGGERALKMNRLPSPDLQAYFSDEKAGRNRFEIAFSCGAHPCSIVAETRGQPWMHVFADSGSEGGLTHGTATLYIDKVSGGEATSTTRTLRIAFAIRAALRETYRLLTPLLLASGLVAAVAATLQAMRSRKLPPPLLLFALGAWGSVAARMVILTLIDATSFPAAEPARSAPALYLSLFAAIAALSISLNSVTGPSTSQESPVISPGDSTDRALNQAADAAGGLSGTPSPRRATR
jgi:hypothetical protein